MKNLLKKLMLAVLIMSLCVPLLTGCGGEKISGDPNVLNIRVFKAGWGDNHIRMLKARFEEQYKAQNYKINIVQSDSSVLGSVVTTELALGNKNGIDLYFPENISPAMVAIASSSEGKMLAEDLTGLFGEYPIRADGTVETKTIREKMRVGQEAYSIFNDFRNGPYDKKAFTFPYKIAPMSLIVNEPLLKTYGLEIPLTSDELIHCFNVIKGDIGATGVYPTSWGGQSLPYMRGLTDAWTAQYDGVDYYAEWVSLNVDPKADGWKLYEDYSGWSHSLTALETIVDLDNTPLGSVNNTATEAQHLFLTGKSVFYVCGAWLQTEMEKNYNEQAKNMRMLAPPVISELGVKLGLGVTKTQSDPYLSAVIKKINEGKDNAAIISEVSGITVTNDQINAIREAKSIFYDRNIFDGAVINAASGKKDIAKLFLKLLASDDGIKIMYDYANCMSSYVPVGTINYADKGAFVASVKGIAEDPATTMIHRLPTGSSLRGDMGLGWFYNAGGVTYADFTEYPMAVQKVKGADIWSNSQKYVRDNWTVKLGEAGF
ncbi:MAG: ABC transporter substrate-binding protein [Firmicutes bacterium]|nr:ABC transporter substrate-binding protein [Bacillota bacterium]